jgi:hypothetical protein
MTPVHETPAEGAVQPSATPAQPSATPAQGSATQTPAKPTTAPWPDWLTTTASSAYAWLLRPRVRLTLTGALLLLVGGLIATNTVWTLPLVIVGALMVAVAWIGHRLEGRFVVEWGEAGTQLAFKATIKAAQPTSDNPALAPASSARSTGPTPAGPAALARSADDVIEGEAHTVEINVTELKALIAAAEAAEAGDGAAAPEAAAREAVPAREPVAAREAVAAREPVAAPEAAVRDIRVRRLADESDRTTRPAG